MAPFAERLRNILQKRSHTRLVRFLEGHSAYEVCDEDHAILREAIRGGNHLAFAALIQFGLSPYVTDEKGRDALYHVIKVSPMDARVVLDLPDVGDHAFARDPRTGDSALTHLLLTVLANKFRINGPTAAETDAIALTILDRLPRVAHELPTHTNFRGETAIAMALQMRHFGLAKLLAARGALVRGETDSHELSAHTFFTESDYLRAIFTGRVSHEYRLPFKLTHSDPHLRRAFFLSICVWRLLFDLLVWLPGATSRKQLRACPAPVPLELPYINEMDIYTNKLLPLSGPDERRYALLTVDLAVRILADPFRAEPALADAYLRIALARVASDALDGIVDTDASEDAPEDAPGDYRFLDPTSAPPPMSPPMSPAGSSADEPCVLDMSLMNAESTGLPICSRTEYYFAGTAKELHTLNNNEQIFLRLLESYRRIREVWMRALLIDRHDSEAARSLIALCARVTRSFCRDSLDSIESAILRWSAK